MKPKETWKAHERWPKAWEQLQGYKPDNIIVDFEKSQIRLNYWGDRSRNLTYTFDQMDLLEEGKVGGNKDFWNH